MAAKKPAPKKAARPARKPSQAAVVTRQLYGKYNITDGKLTQIVKGGQVTKAGARVVQATNARPTSASAFGSTPIGTAKNRLGMFNNVTGELTLNQKRAGAKRTSRKRRPKRRAL